jgi:linoleate 10R-lipoxygenase
MYRLLMRAFPGWYEYNSVYAMYPFTIPDENRKIFKSMKVESEYSYTRPSPPQNPIVFSTAKNTIRILGDQQTFKVTWGAAISRLSHGVDFMLSGDRPANTIQRNQVLKAVYTDVPKGMDEVFEFYTKRTEKLLKERSYAIDDIFQVDAGRE